MRMGPWRESRIFPAGSSLGVLVSSLWLFAPLPGREMSADSLLLNNGTRMENVTVVLRKEEVILTHPDGRTEHIPLSHVKEFSLDTEKERAVRNAPEKTPKAPKEPPEKKAEKAPEKETMAETESRREETPDKGEKRAPSKTRKEPKLSRHVYEGMVSISSGVESVILDTKEALISSFLRLFTLFSTPFRTPPRPSINPQQPPQPEETASAPADTNEEGAEEPQEAKEPVKPDTTNPASVDTEEEESGEPQETVPVKEANPAPVDTKEEIPVEQRESSVEHGSETGE